MVVLTICVYKTDISKIRVDRPSSCSSHNRASTRALRKWKVPSFGIICAYLSRWRHTQYTKDGRIQQQTHTISVIDGSYF